MPKQYIQKEQKDFADKRFVAQTEKMRYTWSKDQEKKQEFLGTIRECEGIINEFTVVRLISERAVQMLRMVNGQEIAFARRENMKHLWSLLNGKVEMVLGLERCFDGSPFSLPILVCYGESGFFTTATISGFYGSEWRTRTGITWGVDYLFMAPVVYLEYSVVQ